MNVAQRSSRRQAIATIAGGAVLGGVWGAAFPALAMESRPTLAAVGHRGAQIVLIDSTAGRALILLGDPDDNLIDRLPAMMTMFRQRIDLIIGSHAVLATRAARLRDRWSIQYAISMQPTATGEVLAMPTIRVTHNLAIGLGGGLTVVCTVGHRDEWSSTEPERESSLWTLTVNHVGGASVIAPDVASIEATNPPGSLLTLVPDLPPSDASRRSPTMAFAVNHDGVGNDDDIGVGRSLTRIYPEDIARFVLHREGIDLPAWTVTI